MSINCYLIFQLKFGSKKERQEFLEHENLDLEQAADDTCIVLYEDYRYAGFLELPPEDRSLILEGYLGEELIRRIKDPRGICVMPEVGQSYEEETYDEIVEGTEIWVPVKSDPSQVVKPRPKADPAEEVLTAVLAWGESKDAKKNPGVAHELMTLVLQAKWKELAAKMKGIPALAQYAKALVQSDSELKPRPPGAVLPLSKELQAFIPEGAEVTSVEEGQGSRAFLRGFPDFNDIFEDCLEKAFQRKDFEDPTKHFTVAQYECDGDLEPVLEFYRKVFEKKKLKVTSENVRSRARAFYLVAESSKWKLLVSYYGDREPPDRFAWVSLIAAKLEVAS